MASGRAADAARAYEEAYSLAIKARQPVLPMEALAGLARIALAENDLDLATERVSAILSELNKRIPKGAAEPPGYT